MKKKKSVNYKSRITQALRRIWYYSPLRREVANRCKVKKDSYKCEKCKKVVGKIEIDHIVPVIDVTTGFIDWNTYIDRLLFCTPLGLQGLCKICHASKTLKENAARKKRKKSGL